MLPKWLLKPLLRPHKNTVLSPLKLLSRVLVQDVKLLSGPSKLLVSKLRLFVTLRQCLIMGLVLQSAVGFNVSVSLMRVTFMMGLTYRSSTRFERGKR